MTKHTSDSPELPPKPPPAVKPKGEAYMQRAAAESRKLHYDSWVREVCSRPTWKMPEPGHSLTRPRSWWRNLVNAHRSGEDKADRDANLRASFDEMHRIGVRDGWAMRCSMPKRDALIGHLACALSGAVVGAAVVWWLS